MTPLPVRITPFATRSIEEAAFWWAQNNPGRESRIREEIERVSALVASRPGIGEPARSTKMKHVRRRRLGRLPYYIYYHRREKPFPHLEIIAVWHVRRGTPPPI